MPVNIRIGKKKEKKEQSITLELNARKSLNGDLMIFDHADIDIVLMVKEGKVLTFPKDIMSEVAYGAQSRLFTFLRKKGIIKYDSVQSGNIYGSMEATLQESKELDGFKVTLINVSNFINEERPYFEYVDAYDKLDKNRVTDPDRSETTELGEVPQEEEKGSIKPGFMRDPYGMNYMYSRG